MKDQSYVSRRGFLQGSALAGAGVLGAFSLASASSASAHAAEPEAWDYETDVVVVGFGIAGTGAACEAADNGAEVILIEKAPEEDAGGSTRVCGGFMTINEGYGDVEACYRYWRGMYDREVIEARLNAWDLVDEFLEKNPIDGLQPYEDSSLPADDNTVGMSQYAHPEGGWKMWPSLQAAVNARGIEVLYSTPAVELVRDEQSGEVIGVIAEQDGNRIALKARKGVILATGSYTANSEMLKQYNHPGIYIASYDSPYNTGDGINLVHKIGGQVWGLSDETIEFQDWAIKQASEELGFGIRYAKPYGDHAGHLMVNKAGKRFMNENINTRHNHEQLAVFAWDQNVNEYVNSPFWMVFDDSVMQNIRLGAYGKEIEIDEGYGTALLISWAGVHRLYGWSDDNSEELEKGWIVKGDTLEELAANMKATTAFGDEVTVDPEGLKEGVAEYNEICETGEDPFGRSPESLQPLGDGPYYAVELCPGAMYCNAGPRTNAENLVVDVEGNPIPRLYAAGQGAMTFFGKSGNTSALTGGMLCGRSAAAADSWE